MNKQKRDWLEAKRKVIGASDVAAILGEDPRKNALDVYLQKVGDIEDESYVRHLAYGIDVENAIANAYAHETGRTVTNRGDTAIYHHPDVPWLGATLDREVYVVPPGGGELIPGALELKSEGGFRKRGGVWISPDAWTDDPPLWHQIQVQIQMECAGFSWGSLAAMFPGYDLRWTDVAKDDDLIAAMLPKLEEFWRHVERREPPKVDPSHPGALSSIKRAWRKDQGHTIALDHQDLLSVIEWELATYKKAECEAEIKMREAELRELMKDATFGALPDGSYLTLKTTQVKGYTKEVKPNEFRALARTKRLR